MNTTPISCVNKYTVHINCWKRIKQKYVLNNDLSIYVVSFMHANVSFIWRSSAYKWYQSIRPLWTDNVPSVYRCTDSQSYNYARVVNDQNRSNNKNCGSKMKILDELGWFFLSVVSARWEFFSGHCVFVPLMASHKLST